MWVCVHRVRVQPGARHDGVRDVPGLGVALPVKELDGIRLDVPLAEAMLEALLCGGERLLEVLVLLPQGIYGHERPDCPENVGEVDRLGRYDERAKARREGLEDFLVRNDDVLDCRGPSCHREADGHLRLGVLLDRSVLDEGVRLDPAGANDEALENLLRRDGISFLLLLRHGEPLAIVVSLNSFSLFP